MNTDSQLRVALKDKLHNFNMSQPDRPQKCHAHPKSQGKESSSFHYKRLSVYQKQKKPIPSVKQARYRQKQIKYYHNRTFYRRKSQLQDIFKQNMRLYQQLNKQKSYYEMNFRSEKVEKKTKKAHSVSCTENCFMTKYVEGEDDVFGNTKPLERRLSFSVGKSCNNQVYQKERDRQNDQKSFSGSMIRPESDFAINIKRRYEKNKTEMLPRKNRLHIQKSTELNSFKDPQINIEPITTNNVEAVVILLAGEKMFTATKNPGIMRMKRRPNSGFRG